MDARVTCADSSEEQAFEPVDADPVGPRWLTREVAALLGTVPDKDIATMVNRAKTTVAQVRRELNIPPAKRLVPASFPADAIPLLGTMPDYQLEEMFSISRGTVGEVRNRLGVARYKNESLPDAAIADIGKLSDSQVVRVHGVSASAVRRYRLTHNIPKASFYSIPDEVKALVGTMSDTALSKQSGICRSLLCKYRASQGIPGRKTPFPLAAEQKLGQIPDQAIADAFGLDVAAVKSRRAKLGIRACREVSPEPAASTEPGALGSA